MEKRRAAGAAVQSGPGNRKIGTLTADLAPVASQARHTTPSKHGSQWEGMQNIAICNRDYLNEPLWRNQLTTNGLLFS